MQHESYDGVWIFRGKHVRKIPKGALVHASVEERMKRKQNKYRPENLPKKYKLVKEYIEKRGRLSSRLRSRILALRLEA